MITREQILKDLEEIYNEQDLSDSVFNPDISFSNLNMNSLDEVEFQMHVEQKYGISISDEIANNLKKPSDYIDLVLEALNQKAR